MISTWGGRGQEEGGSNEVGEGGGRTWQLKVDSLLGLDEIQQDICKTRLALGLWETERLARDAAANTGDGVSSCGLEDGGGGSRARDVCVSTARKAHPAHTTI